jgi:hypothetical protein
MAAYLARSPYRSQIKSASGARKFLKGISGALNSRKRPKNRVCLAARAERRLRVSMVSSQSKSGREAINTYFTSEKKNILKSTMAKFKGATLNYEFGASTIMIGLGFIAIAASLLYLTHFNEVATKGYELKRLEADHQQLLNQYEIKNMKLAEAMSLARISESERVSAMRHPSDVTYLYGTTVLASR